MKRPLPQLGGEKRSERQHDWASLDLEVGLKCQHELRSSDPALAWAEKERKDEQLSTRESDLGQKLEEHGPQFQFNLRYAKKCFRPKSSGAF